MHPNFVYFSWSNHNRNKYLNFKQDQTSTVDVRSSVGVYKNNYGDMLMSGSAVYYWEIKILKGTYFKIGIIKQSEIGNVKKAFSDIKDGYAFYSCGKLRNGINKDG